MDKVIKSTIGGHPQHYEKLGITEGKISEWEDGMRTTGDPGTFEWWYFDAHLNDGSTLVIVFQTKVITMAHADFSPAVSIEFETPDGKKISEIIHTTPENFYASKDTCDVRIGECSFVGNLKEYDIHFKNDKIEATVHLTGTVPAYRPASGAMFFGDDDEYHYAWLPSIPDGNLVADITIDEQTTHYTGTGYHDHNWGNKGINELFAYWYWGRARIGKYQLITSQNIAKKQYGYNGLPTFFLSEGDKILAQDTFRYLTFKAEDRIIDPATGVPIDNRLIYDYNDGSVHYRVTYERDRNINENISAQWAYLRFTGKVTVEKLENGVVVEADVGSSAIWELMYLEPIEK